MMRRIGVSATNTDARHYYSAITINHKYHHHHRRPPSTSTSNALDDNLYHRQSPSSPPSPPRCCHCHFFLWDALSNLKYRHVQSQIKQFTIEGKGGKKFIRPPNSVLNRWYPQLLSGKLKPNGCWICGYSWEDHLKYWWDCRRRNGGVEEFERFTSSRRSGSGEKSHDIIPAFYKHYVREEVARNNNEYEIRHTLDGRVTFMVPRFDPPMAKRNNSSVMNNFGYLFLLALARIQSIAKVEELIWLNEIESSKRTKHD